jgi:diguanylate cyclase (GGDEF)-like protein
MPALRAVSVPEHPEPASVDVPRLRLAPALQLLQQSGRVLPDRRQVGRVVWMQAVLDGLCELSSRDPLTGLANRREFELALASEIDRVARAGEAALVLMIDIDHFKKVNDEHGHPAGDEVLKNVAQALRDCIRPMDTLARFGGDEFAMILPNTEADLVPALLDRVRRAEGVESACPAFSFGVAQCPREATEFDKLVEIADTRLYEAKQAKR